MSPLQIGNGLLADAGVPLLGTGLWLLLIGTAFVSVLEAVLLKRWYTVRPTIVRWTGQGAAAIGMGDEPEEWGLLNSWLLTLGNIASALVGWAFVTHAKGFENWILGSRPLERAGLYLVAVWALAFALSVAVEWPFFSKAIKDRPLSREGLFVSAGCNIVSYFCILAWFGLSGMSSILTIAQIQDPVSIAQAPYGDVYYVNEDTHEVWAVSSNGALPHSLGLTVAPGNSVSAETLPNGHTKILEIAPDGSKVKPLKDFGPSFITAPYESVQNGQPKREQWAILGRYFTPEQQRRYWVHYSPRSYEGLSVRTPNRLYKLGIDSSPLSWQWSHVTVLPNNQAIGQLGPQIVLVDLESGTMGVVAKGVSPTVVLDK